MRDQKKKYLVAGLGASGMAAAGLLNAAGEEMILYDSNGGLDAKALQKNLPEGCNAPIVLGELTSDVAGQTDVCVISPGIPLTAPFVEKLREADIPIWSEIELAYRYGAGRIAAITGTNGKTTTTALVGEILRRKYDQVNVVGNIGVPYTSKALSLTPESVTAVEVSSFQLETIDRFHPNVSAILNITPDHLNRHGSMEEYTRVKESITANQTQQDYCVLNYEDERLRRFGEENCPARVLFFSSHRVIPGGLYLEEDAIISELDGKKETVCRAGELNILGRHNYENAMAAVGIGRALGVSLEQIREALISFKAVEHRIEFVREVDGVTYYNDSKGTNPDAAIQAVQAMTRPTVLIGGGYDKGGSFAPWIASFAGRVRLLILLGQTAERIGKEARSMGFDQIVYVEDMEEAVAQAADRARPGDAVLLSPACASWGMFKNYEERGRIFKELVRAL